MRLSGKIYEARMKLVGSTNVGFLEQLRKSRGKERHLKEVHVASLV